MAQVEEDVEISEDVLKAADPSVDADAAALEAEAAAAEAAATQLLAEAETGATMGFDDDYESRRLAFLDQADGFVEAVHRKEERAAAQAAEASQDDIMEQALRNTREEVEAKLAAAEEAAEAEVQRLAAAQAERAAHEQARQRELEAARLAKAAKEKEDARNAAVAKQEQRAKEAKVIEYLQECLAGNAMAFGEFKSLSSQFRFSKISAKDYYVGVERLVGIDSSEKLMPLLCAALPVEEKRVEFGKIIAIAEKIRARRRAAAAAEEAKRAEERAAARAAAEAQAQADAQRRTAEAEAKRAAEAEAAAKRAAAEQQRNEQAAEDPLVAKRRAEAEAAVAARDAELQRQRQAQEAARRAEEEAAEHKLRLRKFYSIVNESKVSEVDNIFAKHGPAVWGKLVRKYGGTKHVDTVYQVTQGMPNVVLPPRPGTAGAADTAAAPAPTVEEAKAATVTPSTGNAIDPALESHHHEVVAEVDFFGGKLHITMWGAQEVMDLETRKMYVEYVLKCSWSADGVSATWMVPQRYSCFDLLHTVLQDLYRGDPTKKLPKLTGKTFFSSSTSERVKEHRKKRLTVYLKELFTSIPDAVYSGPVDAFLTLTDSVQGVMESHMDSESGVQSTIRPVSGGRLAGTSAHTIPASYLPPRLPSELETAALLATSASLSAAGLLPPSASLSGAGAGDGTGAGAGAGDGSGEAKTEQQGVAVPTLTVDKLRDLDAKTRHLNKLLDDMNVNPLADSLAQKLMKTVRNNLLAVRQAATQTDVADAATLLPLAMQLEEEMLNAERLYSGRVAMFTAQVEGHP